MLFGKKKLQDEIVYGLIKAVQDEVYKTMVESSCYIDIRPGDFEIYVNNEYWHMLATYLSSQAYWHNDTYINESVDQMKIMGHPVYRVIGDHHAYRIVNNILLSKRWKSWLQAH